MLNQRLHKPAGGRGGKRGKRWEDGGKKVNKAGRREHGHILSNGFTF
jgi:hypothetical protein